MTAQGFGRDGGIHANERMGDPLAALVHDSLLDKTPLELLRAKTLSLIGILLFVLVSALSALHLLSGQHLSGSLGLLIAVLGLATTLIIKKHGSIRLAGSVLCAVLWTGIIMGTCLEGYLPPSAARWVVVVPAVAILFGGLRAGAAWFVISLSAAAALMYTLPITPTTNIANSNSLFRFASFATFSTLVVGMIAGTEWLRAWTFKKLRLEEQRNKHIMKMFPDGIALLSRGGEVLETNLAARRIFEEFGEGSILEFARNMVDARADWSSNTGVYLELEFLPINESREATNWILIMRDVTATRLNALTLKRTMESANRASDAKTQFVAMLSHELRTPLNAVVGYSELIADAIEEGDTECVIEDTRDLQLATSHLRALIDATLDLAKIESGKVLLDISDVSIASMIREVSRALRPMVEEKGNALHVCVDARVDADFTIQTDNLKLRQVLINLLSNAAKYTENAAIYMHAHRTPDGIIIAVEDHGDGMSEQTLERVWEEFVQADETALSQNGGTGLGLALVKRLTSLLGGQIKAESTLGTGTTFTITLPAEFAKPQQHREKHVGTPARPHMQPRITPEASQPQTPRSHGNLTTRG